MTNINLNKTIKEILDVQNDEVTLGKIIEAILQLDQNIQSYGFNTVDEIRDFIRDNNLGIDFITDAEQLKISSLFTGVATAADPINVYELKTSTEDNKTDITGIKTKTDLITVTTDDLTLVSSKGGVYFSMNNTGKLRARFGTDVRTVQTSQNGTARPQNPEIGQMFFDTNLHKPIWCGNTSPIKWYDATGSAV